MEFTPSIPRAPVLPVSKDYDRLREQGLAYIQNLSGKIWTDHNAHDPGITILEVLCYALTDLAYRTGFDTVDLLARPDGVTEQPSVSGLFPAHQVLTCAPLTLADFRRLLLRIEGVKNAWLDPKAGSEVPIHADCLEDGLSFRAANAAGEDNHPVEIRGLYRVLVELEIDDELGSLNTPALTFTVKRGPLKGVVLSIESEDAAFLNGEIDFAPDFTGVDTVDSLSVASDGFDATVTLGVQGGPVTLSSLKVLVVEDRPRPTDDPVAVTLAELRKVLEDGQDGAAMASFWRKQQERAKALAKVACALHAHRSLCEDYRSIDTVAPHRIGICADIDVAPEADLEQVQATVFHEIEKYLSPPVRYRTLGRMLDDGYDPDKIFNGPYIDFAMTCGSAPVFTKPGFLTDEDLEASELRQAVHVSDIIDIVADIEGVVAIRDVMLRPYDAGGDPIGESERWTLEVPAGHQPVFFMERSKLLFFKGHLPYRAQPTEFARTLEHLRAMDRAALYVDPDQTLQVPLGRWRNLDEVYPVQHDLPRIYGIGLEGLDSQARDDTDGLSATALAARREARTAQARQLKAYLTVYEQLLADYLHQLAAVRRLFSIDKTLARTYFPPYLKAIAAVRGEFEDELYVDKARLADDVFRTRLTESEETFLDRRNRVLDHLIARFAERFTDYVMLSFRLAGDRLKAGRELIDDKIDFLAEYPEVSRRRSAAFNYRPEPGTGIWNTDNVSGLERRVARLLGIDDPKRRDLACAGHFDALFDTRKVGSKHRVEIKAADQSLLFASAELFATEAAAKAAARKVYPDFRSETTFVVDASGGTGRVKLALTGDGQTLTSHTDYETEAEAVASARRLVERYDAVLTSGICEDEGFHLIEHVLLRPMADGERLMRVCLPEDCSFCGEQDPYSFRISVVLPYWPERFRDSGFRRFVEQTLRLETPAHIHARICWVGLSDMRRLDAALKAWLEAKAGDDAAAISAGAATLLDVLESLKTVYAAASLHDCDEGGDDPIVRLGETNLGLF